MQYLPKPHISREAGFTLVELLVTTAITSIIILAASTLLMTFFLSNSRTTIRRQIKAEGNRALARIEFVARGGQDCENVSSTEVEITNLGGNSTTVFNYSENNITITQDGDTTELLTAFSLSDGSVISCEEEGDKHYIRASLVIRNTDDSEATIEETFTSFTVLRNS